MKVYDVIIIGSGITGNTAAYYLKKEGVKKVLVLEASDSIGHGASSRNGGGVRQSGRDVRELPYTKWGIEHMWPNLSEELGVDIEYRQGGNLRLAKTPEHMKILKKLADDACALGIDVKMVDQYEVHQINPYLSDAVIGASWCPSDGHANCLVTTLAFYKRALELGAEFRTNATVTKLGIIKGKIRKVYLESGEVLEAENVIVGAAYESRAIINTVGLDIPMEARWDEGLITEVQPEMFPMMLGTAIPGFYGHQCANGTFLFGTNSGYEATAKNQLTDLRTNSLTMSAACREIINYIPSLKHAKVVRSWAGWLDLCDDGVPVIGATQEVPGLYLACGFSGHGFATAPPIGYILTCMILQKKLPVDMTALRYNRFPSKC